ncbi:zinc finger protein zpr1-like [Hordeum vulgare subsp. vulgare]|uniref:Zinc finger ZPR1-type domain-containing protein n=1 Tax=Hordeum vulgare subsp. vulgare TaxID=112509 RepID=A0A8I6X2P6_HORVV|nr:zinc finger protein zpr1-like [Hordeum vulgare subsp. vulgare]
MASSGEDRGVVVDIRSAAESAGDDGARDAPLHVVESLCMRCGENGTTRILLTLIPHFREVVLMAFECPHCGERNNEVQFAGQLQPKGCCYTLEVPKGQPEVLNRQVVKSDSATIKIPELDFEIPPEAQRGTLSTVEGSIMRAVSELEALQDERKKVDPQKAEAIEQFLVKLRSLGSGEAAFTFILDDASGNSFIENPNAPSPDPLLSLRFYERTYEQQAALGFLAEPTKESGDSSQDASTVEGNSGGPQRIPHGSVGAVAGRRAIAQGNSDEITAALCRYSAPEEVDTLPSTCAACATECVTRFFSTKIPYFREVIVMATSCDVCGYRNSELKPGGEIPAKGKKTTLTVRSVKDLSRDVIKSDSAAVSVPELELELSSGTLGGIVTTVEGLIVKICEALERVHGFQLGDSTYEWKKKKWDGFTERLAKLLNLEEPWTLILDDALAASFIAPATDSLEDDKQLTIEEYERSWEQNEELGLNDMDTSSADMAYNTTSAS